MARSSPLGSALAVTAGFVVLFAGSARVSAHRLDEYLQVARIGIDPGRVELELDLTPGVAVAEDVLTGIDRDGDGLMSNGEREAYEAAVLAGVRLELDGQPVGLHSTGSSFPELAAMRRGEGTIRLQASGALPSQAGGSHRLFLRNAHRRDVGVYLANALMPANDRVTILAQHRDAAQRELAIDYFLQAPSSFAAAGWLVIGLAAAVGAGRLLARPVRTT